MKFGDLTASSFTLNDAERYETVTPLPLTLEEGQYIAGVIYQGGFAGVGAGNFCMYYRYEDVVAGPVYVPLGCQDTASQAVVSATAMFAPDLALPPATPNPVSIVGANGDRWPAVTVNDIQGSLSVWLCLQKAS